MSTTISIRIPKKLKEKLEELDIDWLSEIRNYLENLIRKNMKTKILKEAYEIRKKIGKETTPAWKIIRENRA
ncbi:MAG: antitoxin [Nitrososphaerota archaeon]